MVQEHAGGKAGVGWVSACPARGSSWCRVSSHRQRPTEGAFVPRSSVLPFCRTARKEPSRPAYWGLTYLEVLQIRGCLHPCPNQTPLRCFWREGKVTRRLLGWLRRLCSLPPSPSGRGHAVAWSSFVNSLFFPHWQPEKSPSPATSRPRGWDSPIPMDRSDFEVASPTPRNRPITRSMGTGDSVEVPSSPLRRAKRARLCSSSSSVRVLGAGTGRAWLRRRGVWARCS